MCLDGGLFLSHALCNNQPLITGLHAALTLEINHYQGQIMEQVISIYWRVALRCDREDEQWDERGRLGAKVNIWSS